MIDIFDDPLILENGRSVQWDAFERQFLSLYRDILRRKGDARQNAVEIVGLCRAAVGGFARKKDFVSLRRVIQCYTSRADVIHGAGGFTDVKDFSIVHYPSNKEKERLQSEVLPRIVSGVDVPEVTAKEPEPVPVQVASPGTIEMPAINPGPAEQDAVSAEQRPAPSIEPDRELAPSSRSDYFLLLRGFLRDAVGTCQEKIMSFLSAHGEGRLMTAGITIRRLFGNLGKWPLDLASRFNRRKTRHRLGRKVGGQGGSQDQDA